MREIPVGQGRVTIVDDADYAWLSQWRWSSYKPASMKCWYVHRVDRKAGKTISMHRLIMGFPAGLDVDHIDGDGLNNCRSNLRACTRAQNLKNRRVTKKRAASASRFKGVVKDRHGPGWRVQLTADGVHHRAGGFATEEAAARAYDKLAQKHHGEFARLNFQQGPFRRFLSRIVSRVSGMQHKSGKSQQTASMG